MSFLPPGCDTQPVFATGNTQSTLELTNHIEISSDDEDDDDDDDDDDIGIQNVQPTTDGTENGNQSGKRVESGYAWTTPIELDSDDESSYPIKRRKMSPQQDRQSWMSFFDEVLIPANGGLHFDNNSRLLSDHISDSPEQFIDLSTNNEYEKERACEAGGACEGSCEEQQKPEIPQHNNDSDKKHKLQLLSDLSTLGKRSKLPPYYDDPNLGLRMYRGPGFEKFPVPLGNKPEHRIICDIWDRIHQTKPKRQYIEKRTLDPSGIVSDHTIILDSDDNDDEQDEDYDAGIFDFSVNFDSFAEITRVLPNISRRFILDLMKSMDDKTQNFAPGCVDANEVLTTILDLGVYPKDDPADPVGDYLKSIIDVRNEHADKPNYSKEATVLLAGEFDFVPTHFIAKTIKKSKSLYDSFLVLQQHEDTAQAPTASERPYHRLRHRRSVIEKKYARKTSGTRDQSEWAHLVGELQAARQHIAEERAQIKQQKQKELDEAANLRAHIESGNVIECQCCFDDEIPQNRIVNCKGKMAHSFCFGCIERLAGNNTGSGKHEMLCMSQDGCKAILSSIGVALAVPPKMLQKLAFNQQQAEIDAVGIKGLEKCPHCDFKGICDPVEIDPVFSCQHPDCGRMTCRICEEPAHNPRTCEEVKKERGLSNTRHLIEEARSLAMMRTCPKCRKKVIKEGGCNKMYCTCGGMLCFVCEKDLSKEGYRHFGAPPKCPQHDGAFNRHDHDADQAERSEITRIRAENPEYEENELRIVSKNIQKDKTILKSIHPHEGLWEEADGDHEGGHARLAADLAQAAEWMPLPQLGEPAQARGLALHEHINARPNAVFNFDGAEDALETGPQRLLARNMRPNPLNYPFDVIGDILQANVPPMPGHNLTSQAVSNFQIPTEAEPEPAMTTNFFRGTNVHFELEQPGFGDYGHLPFY